jgi:hypothetical protein
MLAVALATAAGLSSSERPATQAESGPVAVRVSGVDASRATDLTCGLADLRRRLVRLERALARADRAAFADELARFDAPLAGWEAWPALRHGGRVVLEDGSELYEWPDTTALGLGLAGLEQAPDANGAAAALERAAETAQGLARALARLCRP